MAAFATQMDIFVAARTSGDFLRALTAALTTQNIHLQAVFAFEALGTIITVAPPLVDQAVIALGGNSNVKHLTFLESMGYRRNEVTKYLRKSTPCVRSFLLITALKAALYEDEAVAEIIFQMLSTTSLLDRFAVAKEQLTVLIAHLKPKTHSFLEQFAQCNMEVLTAASTAPDLYGHDEICRQLAPRTIAKVLCAGFQSLTKKEKSIVELRGLTGFIDVATIFQWLAPMHTGISMSKTEVHPSNRTLASGNEEASIIVQAWSDSKSIKVPNDKDLNMWQVVPWSSVQNMALNAVSWVALARPLMGGTAGLFSGVALNAAQKLIL